LKKYSSGSGFDRLDTTYFLTFCKIATLVWVATHTMGTTGLNLLYFLDLRHSIAYFTSKRCKVRCADKSHGTR